MLLGKCPFDNWFHGKQQRGRNSTGIKAFCNIGNYHGGNDGEDKRNRVEVNKEPAETPNWISRLLTVILLYLSGHNTPPSEQGAYVQKIETHLRKKEVMLPVHPK